jgi:hypothetical protein
MRSYLLLLLLLVLLLLLLGCALSHAAAAAAEGDALRLLPQVQHLFRACGVGNRTGQADTASRESQRPHAINAGRNHPLRLLLSGCDERAHATHAPPAAHTVCCRSSPLSHCRHQPWQC